MDIPTEILAVVIAGVFGIGGSYLGAHLNGRSAISTAKGLAEIDRLKYTHDRIWDFRKESYTTILGQLHDVVVLADKIADMYFDEHVNPEEYYEGKHRIEDERSLWGTWTECKKEFHLRRLTLSDAFVAAFENTIGCIAGIDDEGLPPIEARSVATCFEKGHAALLAIALDEIAPTSSV